MRLLILLMIVSLTARAQEDKKVMEPVNNLFEGMKKGDSAMVHSAFVPKARMISVSTDASGNPSAKGSTIDKFLAAVGTPHKEAWNELIWNPKIEIDGNLAQVWVPYAFYAGKTFSHCGIDAFQLFKDGKGEWKIMHLVDTRHKEGCTIPTEVSDKMK